MLKPKRKILRKEIQRDPFLDSLFSFKTHFLDYKQLYTRITIGFIALVIVGTFILRTKASNYNSAELMLSKGMIYVEQGDNQNAIIHLQEVVDEFANTIPGKNASYYLGQIHYDRGDYELALPYFEEYANEGENILLLGASFQALVEIFKSKSNLEDAIQYQKLSRDNASSKGEAAYAALKLANLTYQNGDLISAKAMVKEVLNKHGDDLDIKKVADQLNGLMQVGMPSLN